MNILITGGAGFIGSRCAAWLKEKGHKITLFDNMSYGSKDNLRTSAGDNMDLIVGDVRNTSQLNSIICNFDTILHFAAIAPLPDNQIDPANSYQNNVIGTINVLEACKKHEINRFVLASTSAVYENNTEEILTEDLEIKPDLFYATSKKAAEEVSLAYQKTYNLPVSIVRFFNVYGPNQNYKRKAPPVMGYIIRELMSGQRPLLHFDGSQRRDYIHSDDICSLVEKIINDPKATGEIFNACSGKTWSVNEIFDLCEMKISSNITPIFRDSECLWDSYPELFESYYSLKKERIRKETEKYSCGSFEKSQKILGWEPTIDFEVGASRVIDSMIESVRSNT
jgi:UDP-glucose 4-epimerase